MYELLRRPIAPVGLAVLAAFFYCMYLYDPIEITQAHSDSSEIANDNVAGPSQEEIDRGMMEYGNCPGGGWHFPGEPKFLAGVFPLTRCVKCDAIIEFLF